MAHKSPRIHPYPICGQFSLLHFNSTSRVHSSFFWCLLSITSVERLSEPDPWTVIFTKVISQKWPLSILQNVAQAPLCISLLRLSQQSTTDEEASTTEIYFLIVLEAATIISRGRQIWILPGPLSLASHCPHAAFSLHRCTHGTP